ncbi:MAG: serine/threonine protein kinase [Planctomycetia bacterium]|nr:serine/threonine protein kinase [Planctomycetia bacterium]
MAKLPDRLGTLKLEAQLGVGRHCQIWEALDTGSQARVAVKLIVPEKARDAGQRRLLEHELTVAKSLSHPTVIRIDRLSDEGGLPHLVMELFPHANLKRQIAAGVEALAPRLQRIVTETALALDHLHGRGWVHRDVKPDNVLAAPDGQVKLIDLAIAKRKPGLLGRLLGDKGPVQGSPSYMSPEQIRGEPLDARADIYSLGCVLFELLAGKPPFASPNANDLLNKQVSATPPAIESLNPNATTSVAKLIRQMLAKKPGDRPASMQDVLTQLRSIRFLERAVG